jgi:hypothetical protein
MTVARLAISLDSALAKQVRKAAGAEPLSTWLADAAQRKLRAQGLLDLVAEWEAEHGTLTAAELKKQAAQRRKETRVRRGTKRDVRSRRLTK